MPLVEECGVELGKIPPCVTDNGIHPHPVDTSTAFMTYRPQSISDTD